MCSSDLAVIPRRICSGPWPNMHSYAGCTYKMFLSVIIPTCNAADWLEEQLRALAGQTRLPDEILVVDSASTDATPEIAGRASPSAWSEARVA